MKYFKSCVGKNWLLILLIVSVGLYYLFSLVFLNDKNLNGLDILYILIDKLILSFISALFLFAIFQFNNVKKSINSYFTYAFLNPDFIKAVNSETLHNFMVNSLEVRGCDASLANEVVDFVQQKNEVWIDEYIERVVFSRNEEGFNTHIKREYTLVSNTLDKKYTLKEFLKEFLRPATVRFHEETDYREFIKAEIMVGDELIPLNIGFTNVREDLDNEHKCVITINWDSFENLNKDYCRSLESRIRCLDKVRVIWEEKRVFKSLDNFKTVRIPFWTKGINISIENKIEDSNSILRAYGSGLTTEECRIGNETNRLFTRLWIHPGSGYVIVHY